MLHLVDYIKARASIMATRESSSESSRALSRERRRVKRLCETEEERQTRLLEMRINADENLKQQNSVNEEKTYQQ